MDKTKAKPTEDKQALEADALSRWGHTVRIIGFVAVGFALISAFISFTILMGFTPIEPNQEVGLAALWVNGALVSMLAFSVFWELSGIWIARKRRRAAARLHVRVVVLSLVAAAPAILMAIVASITLNRGLDLWFNTRIKTILNTSQVIAKAYEQSASQTLLIESAVIARPFEGANVDIAAGQEQIANYFTNQARLRNLTAVMLLDNAGEVIVRSEGEVGLDKLPIPSVAALQKLEDGVPALQIRRPQTNVYLATVKLPGYEEDTYLYIARALNPDILYFLSLVNEDTEEYNRFEQIRSITQITFGLLYTEIALIVMLSAIWLGINFANRLVAPIRRLISAAREISTGNLAVRVPWKKSEGDLGDLSQTFNTMSEQLQNQRADLLSAKDQIDERRRFIEAVLSGITTGVIGIEPDGKINLVNRSALRILEMERSALLGKNIAQSVPELSSIITLAVKSHKQRHQGQSTLRRKGEERILNVRITMQQSDEEEHGFVITIDEITELAEAQRRSAWADVARRIAHEIKNPLTPIQLSAERLQRKYGRHLEEDRQIFDQCIHTIIRQVGDIGRMVDEFSSFARMPKPMMANRNLSDAIKEAIFLQEVAHPEITFEVQLPAEPMDGYFDSRLISQALTNIIKNAVESIAAIPAEKARSGRVTLTASKLDKDFEIRIIDNGIGLPQENRNKLLEPYMTTRQKGTGLGLAIVRRIFEEHGGSIELLDAPKAEAGARTCGAMIRLTLPVKRKYQENTGDSSGLSQEGQTNQDQTDA